MYVTTFYTFIFIENTNKAFLFSFIKKDLYIMSEIIYWMETLQVKTKISEDISAVINVFVLIARVIFN